MEKSKHWILCFVLLFGIVAVSQAQLHALQQLMLGPQSKMIELIAPRIPLLQKGLATLQDMKVAKRLGCKPAFDNESPLRAIMPSGCSIQKDICPYTKPMMKCLQIGMIGMCCPFMVNVNTMKNAKKYLKWQKMSEMIV